LDRALVLAVARDEERPAVAAGTGDDVAAELAQLLDVVRARPGGALGRLRRREDDGDDAELLAGREAHGGERLHHAAELQVAELRAVRVVEGDERGQVV